MCAIARISDEQRDGEDQRRQRRAAVTTINESERLNGRNRYFDMSLWRRAWSDCLDQFCWSNALPPAERDRDDRSVVRGLETSRRQPFAFAFHLSGDRGGGFRMQRKILMPYDFPL
jgi:hypothetical protein